MKKMGLLQGIMIVLTMLGIGHTYAQWSYNSTHIYNNNTGNVGIGNNSPTKLLNVGKNMTEPTVLIRNFGGTGGATFEMIDDASGANWKFKATNAGGFKIRDNLNGLDVFTIESNSSANVLYINGEGSLGIGTATPASTALVDMSSTTKGVLIPRMTQSQMQSITSPENGLQVFCTTDGKMYIYVSQMALWKEVAYGAGGFATPCSIGSSMTVNHVAGSVAPVTKTVTYGLVTNIPGEPSKCWISRNLGADQQATSVSDATEESAGWYWQFNRQQGYKHDGSARTPNTTWITVINDNSDWTLASDPCALLIGSGWRLPTSTEWTNVDANGGWTNWNGPWNSALKMHAAGFLNSSSGSLAFRGSHGYYWSSSQLYTTNGWYLKFYSGYCYLGGTLEKAYGFSSRCLRD